MAKICFYYLDPAEPDSGVGFISNSYECEMWISAIIVQNLKSFGSGTAAWECSHTHTDKQTDTLTYRSSDDFNIPSFQMVIISDIPSFQMVIISDKNTNSLKLRQENIKFCEIVHVNVKAIIWTMLVYIGVHVILKLVNPNTNECKFRNLNLNDFLLEKVHNLL